MSETPANGTVVETTTRKRILSADKANENTDFWEYLAKLSPEDASRHILYVYRDEPGPRMQWGKFVYPWTEIPWNDREEAEAVIAQRWGGRRFEVLLKDRSQIMRKERIFINAPPKAALPPFDAPQPYQTGPQVYPNTPNQYGPQYGDTARVAETAIHTVANQEKQAVEIGISALAQAANVIKNFSAQPPAPAPGPTDELMKQMMAVMIQRMMVDPFENLTKMMTVMQTMQNASNPTGPLNPLMQKFLDVAAERVFNPPAASGPAVSMGAELIRQLPSIAGYVTQGMADYARIMEAQRDAIAMQRGATPGQVVTQPTRPQLQPQTIPPPQQPAQVNTAPNPANGANMLTDPMTFIEQKIVEILNEPQSAEWAAEETLNFLDRMDRTIVPQLCKQGEQGLMALFQSRPTLKPALSNPARLGEFIRAFLHYASEDMAAADKAVGEQKPN